MNESARRDALMARRRELLAPGDAAIDPFFAEVELEEIERELARLSPQPGGRAVGPEDEDRRVRPGEAGANDD